MAFHTSASLLMKKASITPHVITALFTLPLKATGENTSTVFVECNFRQERSRTEELNVRYALACRDVTERPSGQQHHAITVFQRASLLRHDKLKHIGHLIFIGRWHESGTMCVVTSIPYHYDLIYSDVATLSLCIAKMQHSGFNLNNISTQTR